MIYWDTSCVLKLYAEESDSTRWEDYALSASDEFASSALLEIEMACALEQKEARGEIKAGAAAALLLLFRRDVQARRFTLYPVGTDVLMRAGEIAAASYHASDAIPLRTLDALHLATVELAKCRALACTDKRMRVAASLRGIDLV